MSIDRLRRAFVDDFAAPLVAGGTLHVGNVIGARRAMELSEQLVVEPPADAFDRERDRVARSLVDVGWAPAPSASDWRLVIALHDLFASTHPELDTWLRRDHARRAERTSIATLSTIAPPRTVGAAIARHTLVARAPEIVRHDGVVAFWAGTRAFRGRSVPQRLLAWPSLRRVQLSKTELDVFSLGRHSGAGEASYRAAFSGWLGASPITALSCIGRTAFEFAFSDSILAIIADPLGRRVALRAAETHADGETARALGRALSHLHRLDHREGGRIAFAFAVELLARVPKAVTATGGGTLDSGARGWLALARTLADQRRQERVPASEQPLELPLGSQPLLSWVGAVPRAHGS